ncbi:MAG TPA: monovalent cation/H+ antiporter complex subunit F [Terriglobales bacterium]|jgi:multicomponent Na+:H+ antiporter subunit F|nr:monovalent cation/H+ antiporter complex subunit F [Terriglobales bacterium]
MNVWLVAAVGMMLCLIPCAIVCFRGEPSARLVGLEMAGVIDVMILVLLAEGFHRPPFYDLALALGLLSFAAGLVFARFLERWL